MADIIDLEKERPRLLAQRAGRVSIAPNLVMFVALCAWPLTWPLLVGQAAIDATRAMWRRPR